uniref:serine-rich adhesin for platelets-like isoform X2 n=1 Tax=Osmia lignaria TaxID=473952 RepID=UPI00147978C2|nr:serine-rich adhesin for platelets-like isoform X2 [Osmia lignaria]
MKGVTILLLVLLVHTFDAHNKHEGRMTKLEKKHTLKREAAVEKIRKLYEKLDEKDSEESERRKPPNISNLPAWKRKPDSSDSDCDSSSTKDSSNCESSSSTDEIRSSKSRLHKQSNSKHEKYDSRRQKKGDHAIGHKATLNLLENFEEQFKRLLKKLIPRVKERIHIIQMLKYHRIESCQSLSPLQFFYKRLYEYNKARYMAWRKKLEIRNYILSHMNHLDAEAIMRKCNIQRNIPYALRRAQMKRCINVYASINKIFKIVTKLPRPSLNPADEILWLCNKTSLHKLSTTVEKNSKDTETTAKITTQADADNYPSPITEPESKNHTSTTESTRHRGSIKAPSSTTTSKETENTTTSRISIISSAVETTTEATNTIQSHITTTSSSTKPSSLTHRKRLTTSSVPTEQPSPTIIIQNKNRTPSRERPKTWSGAPTTNAGTATIEGQKKTIISNSKPSLVTTVKTIVNRSNEDTPTSNIIQERITTLSKERPAAWSSAHNTNKGPATVPRKEKVIINGSKPLSLTTATTLRHTSIRGSTHSPGPTEHTSAGNIIQERVSPQPRDRPVAWSSAHTTSKRPAAVAREEEVIISDNKPLLLPTAKTIGHTSTDGSTNHPGPSEHTSAGNIIQERVSSQPRDRPVAWSSTHTTTKTPTAVAREEEVIISDDKPSLLPTAKTIGHTSTAGSTNHPGPSEHTSAGNIIQERVSSQPRDRSVAWSSTHTTTETPTAVAREGEVIISDDKPSLLPTAKTIGHTSTDGSTNHPGPSQYTSAANIMQERISPLSRERPVAWSSAHTTTKRPATVAREEEVIISDNKPSLLPTAKSIGHTSTDGSTNHSGPSEHTSAGNIIQESVSSQARERPIAWNSANTTTKRPTAVAREEEVIISDNKPSLLPTAKTIGHTSTDGSTNHPGPSQYTSAANIMQERISPLSRERPAAWSSAHTTSKRPAAVASEEEVIISDNEPSLGATAKTIGHTSTDGPTNHPGPSEHTSAGNIIQESVSSQARERPVAWNSAHTTTKRPATVAREEEVIISDNKPSLLPTAKTIGHTSTDGSTNHPGPSEHTSARNIIQESVSSQARERPVAWNSAHTTTKRPAAVAREEEVIISDNKPSLLPTAKTIGHTSTDGSTNHPGPSQYTSAANIMQERISPLSRERPAAWSSAHTTSKRPAAVASEEEVIISDNEPSLGTTAKTIGHTSTDGSTNHPGPSEHTSAGNIIQESVSSQARERPVAWTSAHTTTKRPATVAREEEVIISDNKPSLLPTAETIGHTSTDGSTNHPGPSEHTSARNIIQESVSSQARERPVAWNSAHTTTKRPAAVAREEEVIISDNKPSLLPTAKTIGHTSTDGSTNHPGPSQYTSAANIMQERISPLSRERPAAWSSAHTTSKRPAAVASEEEVIISDNEPSLGTTAKTIGHTSTDGSTNHPGPSEHTSAGNIIQESVSSQARERPVAWNSAHTTTKRPATVAREEEVIISDNKPSLLPTAETIGHTSTDGSTNHPGPSQYTSAANIMQERISPLSRERPAAWSSAHTTSKRPAAVASEEEVIISDNEPSLGTTAKTIGHTSTDGSTNHPGPSEPTSAGNIIQESVSSQARERPVAWSSAHTTTKRPAAVAREEEVIISDNKPSLLPTAETIGHTSTDGSTNYPGPSEHTSAGNIIQESVSSQARERPVAWNSAHTTTKRPAAVAREEEVIISDNKPSLLPTAKTIGHTSSDGSTNHPGPSQYTSATNIMQERISPLSRERTAAWSSAHTTSKRPAAVASEEEVIISDNEPSLGTTAKTIGHTSTDGLTNHPGPSEHTSAGNIIQESVSSQARERPVAWNSAHTTTERPATVARKEEVIISDNKPSLLPTAKTIEHTSTDGSTNHPGPSEHTSAGNIIQESVNSQARERPVAWNSAHTTTERPATVAREEEVIISDNKPSLLPTAKTIGHTITGRSTNHPGPSEHTSAANIIQERISSLSKERPVTWSSAHTTSKTPAAVAREEEVIISDNKPSLLPTAKTIGHTSTDGSTNHPGPSEHTSAGNIIQGRVSSQPRDRPVAWSGAHTTSKRPAAVAREEEVIISDNKPSLGTTVKTAGHSSTGGLTSEPRPSEHVLSGNIIQGKVSTLSWERPTPWIKADTISEGTAKTAWQREAIISGSKSSSVKIVETIGHTSTERPTSRPKPTEQTSPESTIYDRINTISSSTPTIWSSANTTTDGTVTAAKHGETIISNSKPSLGTIIETIVHTATDRPTSEPTEQTSSGTIIYDRINTISSGTPITWSGADTTIIGTVTAVGH